MRRGLQLHLLSALGEIWREERLPTSKEETAKGGSISLSMVMEVSARGASLADVEARHLLEENGKCQCIRYQVLVCYFTLNPNKRSVAMINAT